MKQELNLRNYVKNTGKDPWGEIRYRANTNFITRTPTMTEDNIFSDFTRMKLKKDKSAQERMLIDSAMTLLYYNLPRASILHGICRELINYAALSAPDEDEFSGKVYDALIEEIEANVGVSVSRESVGGYLCLFASQMQKSMEAMQHEFTTNREAIEAYIA